MPSPAEVVRKILIDAELVVWPGIVQQPDDGIVQCICNAIPDDPDSVLMVKDTAGMMFGREMKGGKQIEHPGIQILARSLDRNSGYDLLTGVTTFLAGILTRRSVLVRSTWCFVSSVYRTTNVISLGEERGTKRFLWSCNYRVAMEDVAELPLE